MAPLRHKRDTNARPTTKVVRIAAPIALAVTLGSVGVGVLAAAPEAPSAVSANQASLTVVTNAEARDRFISRSFSRENSDARARALLQRQAEREATRKAIRRADTRLWSTAPLNLWTDATRQARKVGVLDSPKRVLVTGRRDNGRAEIVLDGQARWVTAAYLAKSKPKPPEDEESSSSGGTSAGVGGACTNGTSVSGQPNVIAVHRATCANFPDITSYGTYRADGEHAQGIAIDIMVSGSRGWQVAEFLRANYSELGISYIIYSQKIWSVERSGEGWRWMSDRGSTTANHYDHVHVTTY